MNRLTPFPATGAEHDRDLHGCTEASARESFTSPRPSPQSGEGAELSPLAMLPRENRGGGAPTRPHETAAANPFPDSTPAYYTADCNPPATPPDGACNSGRAVSTITGAHAPEAPDTFPSSTLQPFNPSTSATATTADWHEAEARARVCEDFLQLTAEGYSLRQAAKALGKGVAFFSGVEAPLAIYQRDGVPGLLPQRRRSGAKVSFTVPDWFIPAAKFFYLLTNRTWNSGSVPEAIRRVISLPHLPVGWDRTTTARFLKAVNRRDAETQSSDQDLSAPPRLCGEIPACPPELRELILARQKAGQPLVPERLARQITASAATVRQHRNPTEAGLGLLNAPGSMMWSTNQATGERQFIRAGDWVEADDGTINFPVCIPWTMGGCDCSDKFGVKVGRFQFLRPIDAGSRYRPGFLYVARPRGSYRREDVLALMRMVCRAMGVPRGWRFERGTWESHMVKEAVRLLGSQLQTVYSPRQKPFVEGGFNQDWTKLSVHFPRADIGRFMGETEAANELLVKCKRGTEDPTKHFPLLDTALAAFDAITREENATPVNSANWGRWIPEERFAQQLAENPCRRLNAESDWIFHPYVREWTVKGMTVGGRVPLFEELSVPFDFAASWLPNFDGAKVRVHFDPTEARCVGTVVYLEGGRTVAKRGDVLGHAQQINETAGYVRLVMGWGDDPASLGRKLRQQTASAMRREVRAILPNGRSAGGESELRDGLGQKAVVQRGDAETQSSEPNQILSAPPRLSGKTEIPDQPFDRAARLAELDQQEAAMSHLFD